MKYGGLILCYVSYAFICPNQTANTVEVEYNNTEDTSVRPKLTSLNPLFKGSDMLTKARLLLVHGSNFDQITFLPPPQGVEPRLAGCKSVSFTTQPWLLPTITEEMICI